MTETITALVREPFALLMAVLALVLVIVALSCVRWFDRLLMIGLALISGATALIMINGLRWR
jgi:hypothetical protein